MKLIDKINQDFMAAYKAKDMVKKDFLGVLKTEVTKESKEPDDTFIIGKIKSMIKNAESTNSLSAEELEILNSYLPAQLSEDELEKIINDIINEHNVESPREMGKVMSNLKASYDGQYDGKIASTLIKKILS